MCMLDWNTYREQIIGDVGERAKLSPHTLRGYGLLSGGSKTGHLNTKTREPIAVSLRCDICTTSHVGAATKPGATREEIAKALGVAISINAGAATSTLRRRSTSSRRILVPGLIKKPDGPCDA